jgi:acylphosphatase
MSVRLGLTGWVRNMPDGRVEAVFEGEEEAVTVILDFCRRGPRRAAVENVAVVWEPFKGEFSGFSIRR